MQSGTDQIIDTTKQELNRLKDFLISPLLKLALLSNHLTHKQPHELSETHETRALKPPAARCVNVQAQPGPWQCSAEPVCGVGGAELDKSALHLQDKLRAQGWQPVHSQCRTMPVLINRKSLWPPLLLGILW